MNNFSTKNSTTTSTKNSTTNFKKNTSYKILIFSLLILFSFNPNISLAYNNACNSKNFLSEVKTIPIIPGLIGVDRNSRKIPSAAQLNFVKKTLIKACRFFEPVKLQIPNKLSVVVVNKSNQAFFHDISNTLFIPIQLEIKKGVTKHPVHSVPIAIHELGHAYFNSNMLSVTENKTYSVMQNEWGNLSSEVFAIKIEKRRDYSTPFGGLTELFSDSFAAVYFNNPEAMSDGLYFTALKQIHKIAKKRNFLNRNFQHLAGKKLTDISVHNQFDKARHHLWKYYLSNPTYKNKPKLIKNLLKIFNVFLHQKQNESNFQDTDIILANDLLIDFMDKSFKKLYL